MPIKLVISRLVTFAVSGQLNDAEGVAQPFDFSLTCERQSQEEINAMSGRRADESLVEFFAGPKRDANGIPVVVDGVEVPFTTGWKGVHDEAGNPVPYSADGLRSLLSTGGMAALVYMTYRDECGAKRKN